MKAHLHLSHLFLYFWFLKISLLLLDEPGPAVSSFMDVVLECCKTVVPMKPSDDCHISLTRTVVLRHHWIESFIESVRDCIKELPR